MLSNAIKIHRPTVVRLSPTQFQQKLKFLAETTGTRTPPGVKFSYTVSFLVVDPLQRVDESDSIPGTGVTRIKKAALKGTLNQEIWILNNFSTCEEKYILEHEKRHARDNQNTVRSLHQIVRKHPDFPNTYFLDVVESELKKNNKKVADIAYGQFGIMGAKKTKSRDHTRHGHLAKTMKLIKQNCNAHVTLGYQFLKRGSSGSEVFKLQMILNGYLLTQLKFGDMLLPDGQFGSKTQNAVKLFQADRCKPVDGIVGPKTSEALHLS